MKSKKILAPMCATTLCAALAVAGCSNPSSSDSSAQGAKELPKPSVSCDLPKENIDGSAIDTDGEVKGEITFLTQGEKKQSGPYFEEAIARFEKENPGTKVNWVTQAGGPDFDTLITTQAKNCKMPDVVTIPATTIVALSRNNLLLDLDTKAPGLSEQYLEGMMADTNFATNGNHTAVPWYVYPPVFTYNTDVFERNGLDPQAPPKTSDEFLKLGHTFAEAKTGDNYFYGNMNWMLPAYWHAAGGKLMNEDSTEFVFAQDKNVLRWLEEVQKLYASNVIPPDSLTDQPDPGKAYLLGNLALGSTIPTRIKSLEENNSEVFAKTDVAEFPQNEGVDDIVVAQQWVGVSATTKNAKLALKFAKFFAGEKEEYLWARHNAESGKSAVFPGHKKALENFRKDPGVEGTDLFKKAFKIAAEEAPKATVNKGGMYLTGEVSKTLIDAVNSVMRGEAEPKPAMEAAQKKMNKMLKKLIS